MSGLLKGLRSVYLGSPLIGDAAPGSFVREDDVIDRLRSERIKRAIAADLCEHEGVGKACIDCTFKAESVQQLLAGGDDE